MTYSQIRRLIRLHQKAEWHTSEYKRLLQIRSARWKALRHLQKAEQLYFQISRIIRDSTSVRANSDGSAGFWLSDVQEGSHAFSVHTFIGISKRASVWSKS